MPAIGKGQRAIAAEKHGHCADWRLPTTDCLAGPQPGR
jgi:hypothetical protein